MSDLSNIKVGDFAITINDVSETNGKLNQYYNSEDLSGDSEFVTFDVTVKNNGEAELELGPLLSFALTGEDGSICTYCVSDGPNIVKMAPGTSTNFKISYIVPKNTALHFRFTPDLIRGHYMDLPVSF